MAKKKGKTKKTIKKNNNSQKQVTAKQAMRACYKWAKVLGWQIDELEKRIELIEEFLGGRESMKKILKDRKPLVY